MILTQREFQARQEWIKKHLVHIAVPVVDAIQGGVGTVVAVPGAPILSIDSYPSSTSVSISWSTPSGSPTSYNIYVDDVLYANVASSPSTVSGLTMMVEADIYVKAVNASGEGSASNVVTANTVNFITTPTIQYKCNEASGSLLDSLGTRHLTAINSPSSVAGTVGNARGYDGSNNFSAVADAVMMCLGVNFGVSVIFKVGSASGTRQIVSCRNAGSGDGDLLWILRFEGTDLKLYVGNGEGLFSVFTIGSVVTNGIYHCAFSVINATGEVRGVFDGSAAFSIGTSAYVPTTSPSAPKLGVGGDVLELLPSGSWTDAIQIWSGHAPTDAELEALGTGVEF